MMLLDVPSLPFVAQAFLPAVVLTERLTGWKACPTNDWTTNG